MNPSPSKSCCSRPIPAVLYFDPNSSHLRIAALSLLDRLIVAAHRAGCSPITVVHNVSSLPPLQRTQALGIPFLTTASPPTLAPLQPVFVAQTNLWIPTADLSLLLISGGRLVAPNGTLLPAALLRPTQAQPTHQSPWDLAPAQSLTQALLAAPVTDLPSAQLAENTLWKSLTSASDGTVDRWFNRPVGQRLFSRWIAHTPITPNQISIAATLLGVAAGFGFSLGHLQAFIWSALAFQLSAIIDCVDGDIARALFKETPLGKWIDIVGDQIVHACVFAGIAFGLWRAAGTHHFLWLGTLAVSGALLSFFVVLRGLRPPHRHNLQLQKLIDRATNRDFSVVVLLLACIERLEWFLWMAAAGSHLFWMLALLAQFLGRSVPKRGA